jgi:PmbA protein
MTIQDDTLQLLSDLLKHAKAAGATAADAVLADSTSQSITRRLGEQESLSRSEEADIGLRVFVGQRQAVVSSSDRSKDTLTDMVERAVAMARAVPEDEFAGIAAAEDLATAFPDLELYDGAELSAEQMNDMADACEQAARDVPGVTNSEGAECAFGHETVYFVTSNGFAQSYKTSGYTLSVSVVAGRDLAMETDYDYDSSTFLSDLKDPASIGRSAGERTVRALNPVKKPTGQLPVVFDRRVSGGLIGYLAGAVSGSAVARGTTLLKDKMHQQVFNKNITIVDDPFVRRGNRSHPFDGEGVTPQKRNIIENGILTGWVLDIATARQLGLKTTGNAGRGASSPPSPRVANFHMLPGSRTPEDMLKNIDEGFYVTQMMGSTGNPVLTGDYSRGARGFWIEKGQITHAVAEMTIAGNLRDMWMTLEAANDLELKYGVDAPTILIENMMVAGA